MAILDKTIEFDDDPEVKGWTQFLTFVPDLMLGMNNRFYSFKDGDLYLHGEGERNTFYGVYNPSIFTVIFNDSPEDDKIFKTIVLESDQTWNVDLETNYTNGSIDFSEFNERESRYFAYIRRNENTGDYSAKSTTGLGELDSIDTLTLTFGFIDDSINVGDKVYQLNAGNVEELGTIISKTATTLTFSVFNNTPIAGLFCFSTKDARIESSGIRGYYLRATFTNNGSNDVEVFAVNTNTVKSYV